MNGSVSAAAIVPESGEGVRAVADGVASLASLDIDSKASGTVTVQCDE